MLMSASKGSRGLNDLVSKWSLMKIALSQKGAQVSATALALEASELLWVTIKQKMREEEREEELNWEKGRDSTEDITQELDKPWVHRDRSVLRVDPRIVK